MISPSHYNFSLSSKPVKNDPSRRTGKSPLAFNIIFRHFKLQGSVAFVENSLGVGGGDKRGLPKMLRLRLLPNLQGRDKAQPAGLHRGVPRCTAQSHQLQIDIQRLRHHRQLPPKNKRITQKGTQ